MTRLDQQDTELPEPSSPRAADASGRSARWSLLLELLLILLVVRSFRIEERRGLFELLLVVLLSVPLYRQIPLRWRPTFFLAISLLSFPLAFALPHVVQSGWLEALAVGATQSAWVFGIGMTLFGLCHLPLALPWRAASIAVVAAGLAYWRSEAISPFWAVLGSMFMFRLWIYARELRRERKATTWSTRLSYFFLLPNAFFPFFPIIDYRRFRDGFVDDVEGVVAQRGVAWILRGIIHLLLYRAVKIYLLPAPIDLIDIEYLALFLVTNYALYLQISGHFHIITGLLHLFGFDLPRTHDRYFLASSFSDIWRRINIYWKDFLTEHVFYPAFFTLRRLPKPAAIVAAVGVTFIATWLLHSWQAFWLLGDFPIATRDAALWLSAGSLVAVSSLWQYRAALKGPRRTVGVTPASAFFLSLKVLGTFTTVSFFWACWTVPKFPQLVAAVAMSGGITLDGAAVVGGTILTAVTAGTILQLAFDRLRDSGVELSLPLERSPLLCAGVMGMLVIAGMPAVHGTLGHSASQQMAVLQHEVITADEARRRMEGYYEGLAAVNLQSDPLFSATQDSSPRSAYFDAVRERNDILEKELIPGWKGEVEGHSFQVNRWGMRDDDLPRRKPPGHYRVAIIGSSGTMGYGVAEDGDFESIVERRVNATIGDSGPHVEFLNFALGHYDSLHAAGILREKAIPFDLDAAFFFADQSEVNSTNRLANASYLRYPLPYPCLEEVLQAADITEDTSWGMSQIQLQNQLGAVVACTYRGIAKDCHERGITPVWVFVPMPGIEQFPSSAGKLLADLARDAGFVVIDLSSWADGRQPEDVMLDAYHPNALGHRLIALKLIESLEREPRALPPLRSTDATYEK